VAEAQTRVAPQEFFGANGADLRHYVLPEDQGTLDSLATSMSEQGVDWARITFAQHVDNAAPGSFNWYSPDKMVAALARQGVRAEGMLIGTAVWTSKSDEVEDCDWRARPYNLDAWGDWTAAAVARFGTGGAFWNEHPELPELPIQRWEVGNEPNSKMFFCPKADPEQYAGIYSASLDAIKGVDPGAEVMVGGLAPRFGWTTAVDLDVPSFLERMTAADPTLVDRIDSVGIHPYGATPDETLYLLSQFRQAMTDAGLADTPMIANELGWYTQGEEGPLKATEAERAEMLDTVTSELWRTDCGVEGMAPYSWVTLQQDPALGSQWWGLTDVQTGEPLPSGLAYGEQIRVARGLDGPPPQSTITACDGPTLSVARTGSGTVTSSLGTMSCGAVCTDRLPGGSELTLTAAPAAGYAFRGWTGCDSVAGDTCTVTMEADREVQARFVLQRTLAIDRTGPGTLTSAPAAIDCGSTCSARVDDGAQLTLTAQPAAGHEVRFWSGCAVVNGNQCTVSMTDHRTVFVGFIEVHSLSVAVTGLGNVVNSVLGLLCTQNCSTPVQSGNQVILYAEPAPGYVLEAWVGCDAVQGNACYVTVEAAGLVSVRFVPERRLTVQKSGSGTVTSAPAAINCGATCQATLGQGTTMNLTATPAAGYAFAGWSGCDSPNGAQCPLTLGSADRTVTATFAPQRTLAVEKTGPGSVSSSPAAIDCGTTCSAQVGAGGQLVLTAHPEPGYGVRWWSGCASISGNQCTVSMSDHRTVFAGFVRQHPLTVQRTGPGTVVNTTWGIDCGQACTAQVQDGYQVILYATPSQGYEFGGWTGCQSVDGLRCYVTMSEARNVTARFVARRALSVQTTGSGHVTSSPAGIDCWASCAASFDSGTQVTLTAEAAPGYVFKSWTGCDSVAAARCTVSMGAERTVAARFVLQRTLAVEKTGSGAVASSAAGIDCGAACSAQIADGDTVTLTAHPEPGYGVRWWSGCASTSGNQCTVSMTDHRTVFAGFVRQHPLTVERTGPGTVVNATWGIDCGQACSAAVQEGYQVALHATPAQGYEFRGWTGCQSVNGTSCYVMMTEARAVRAAFGRQRTVSVQKSGSGRVTSSTAALDCGATCSAEVEEGTSLTLTATPDPGHSFGGWSGCDSTSAGRCTVAVGGDRAVTATFAAVPPPETSISGLLVKPRKRTATLRITGAAGSGDMSFRCRIDSRPLQACERSETFKLRPGRHTFRAVAVDSLGREDPTPAVRTFRIRR
jgi:hypothetical protein